MAKATLTIAIGGEYNGKAIDKAEKALRDLNVEAARHAGGMTESFTKAGDSLVKLGSDMQRTGSSIEDLGAKTTKLTAPIAAIGAASVKLASDYENAVAKVYTIMDKGVMSTEQISKAILDLSTKTGKSAVELADASYQALSASISTDKVAGFVEDAVKLSKAGFTETATAVDTLTTVINAYGYSADDAQAISDKLVQTQNKGKTTVDELSQSMGNVIPTASAYNVSLDNLCSAYVVMTKQGINTANATTAINGMLTELADEGSTVASVLKEKTGKSFGQLMADGMDLGEVIGLLSESVDGDSEAFANLWGNVRASKGALAIANAGASEFSGTMKDMAKSTGLCDKALEDLETPAQKANKAINAVKNTGIELGEEILGAAVPSLDKMAEMAQGLYKWFGSLDESTKQAIVKFGALAVAAGPVLTVFGRMYSGLGGLVTKLGTGMQSIGAFSAAMKASEASMKAAGATTVGLGTKIKAAAEQTGIMTKATNLLKGSLAAIGITAAVAAIGLLVGKFMEWKEHNDKVEKATRSLEGAVGAAKAAYDAYTPSVEGSTRALEDNRASADEALESQAALADRMTSAFKDIGTNAAMVDRYAQTIAELGEKGNLADEDIVRLQAAVDGFNQLTGAGIEITNGMTGELNTSRDAILGVAEAYKEEAKAAAAREMLVEVNKQILQDEMALKSAKDDLAQAEEAYQYQLANFPDSAYTYGQAVTDAERRVNEMEAALSSARKSEQDLVDVLTESPGKFKTMEDALASCGESVKSLGDITDEQLAAIEAGFDGSLSSIYKSCIEQGASIPEGLKAGMESSAEEPKGAVERLAQNIIDSMRDKLQTHSPSRVMYEIGKDIDSGLGGGIDDGSGEPADAMSRVAEGVEAAISSVPGNAQEIGGQASYSFARGVGENSAYYEGQDLAVSARDGMGSVDPYDTGWDFSVGFANGMNGPDIFTTAWNIGLSALGAIKGALGIASPSKEAAKVGEWFGQGAVEGMKRTEAAIAAETGRLGGLMSLQPAQAGFGGISYGGLASHAQPSISTGGVTLNAYVTVNADGASKGKEIGESVIDAIYGELSRRSGSRLWDALYSTV